MKSIKKLILVQFVIFVSILSGCESQYNEHFYSQRNIENKGVIGSGDFTSSGEIIGFPQKEREEIIISYIKNAKERIWIEVYGWIRLQKIYDALGEAKKRGIDIRVLLEGNPYGTPTMNVTTKKFLEKNSIPVKYTDNNRFFDIPDHILISPLNSREKIEDFINGTKENIYIYVQAVSDNRILKLLKKLQKENKNIVICTADNEGNKESSKMFPKIWHFGRKPYLHAKIMLRDDEMIFLGSQNFTKNSLENNREIGIFLKNRSDLIKTLKMDIQTHCER